MFNPNDSAAAVAAAVALDMPAFSKATADATRADAVSMLFSNHGMQCRPWARRIIAAAAAGTFNYEDRRDAGDWNRCAIAAASAPVAWVRVLSVTRPADSTLIGLADEFNDAVQCDRFSDAAVAVIKIEQRAAALAAAA